MINKDKEGVSLACIRMGDEIMKMIGGVIAKEYATKCFEPLMECAMKRFRRYKPATQAAMKEYMEAEHSNPAKY